MAKVYIKYWLTYCISVDLQMIYTHSLTRARDSVNSHVTRIHSRKRCKPGKNGGFNHRQVVVAEIKASVGRREETVRHTLAAI